MSTAQSEMSRSSVEAATKANNKANANAPQPAAASMITGCAPYLASDPRALFMASALRAGNAHGLTRWIFPSVDHVARRSHWGVLAVAAVASALLLGGCAAPGASTAQQSADAPLTAVSPATSAPPPVALADLITGADWVAIRIEGVPVVTAPVPRLRWLSAEQISGSGGCNQFAGKAVLQDGVAQFGPLASTRMMCLPQPSGQEDKFFKALEATARLRLERGILVLLDAQGKELVRLNRQGR